MRSLPLCLLVPWLCSEPLELKYSQRMPSIGPGQDEQNLWGNKNGSELLRQCGSKHVEADYLAHNFS